MKSAIPPVNPARVVTTGETYIAHTRLNFEQFKTSMSLAMETRNAIACKVNYLSDFGFVSLDCQSVLKTGKMTRNSFAEHKIYPC